MDFFIKHKFKVILGLFVILVGLVGWFISPQIIKPIQKQLQYQSKMNVAVKLSAEEVKNTEKEIAELENAIKIGDMKGHDTVAPLYLQIGMDFERLGRLALAQDAYTRALAAAPKNYIPLANLGNLYQGIKDYKAADGYFRKAIELAPKEGTLYSKLAELYWYGFADLEKTRGIFLEGLIRTNSDQALMRSYASFLEQTGNKYEAYLYWEAISKLAPQDQAVKDNMKALLPSVPKILIPQPATKPVNNGKNMGKKTK